MSDLDVTALFFDYVRKLETQNKAMRLEIEKLKGNLDKPEPVKAEPLTSADMDRRNEPVVAPEAPTPPPRRPVTPPLPGGRSMGFEGDPCPECGAMMMSRNGSCLKCHACGATTGCS